jgi:predicted GH43/DUF377 family glycosyl hydrolase
MFTSETILFVAASLLYVGTAATQPIHIDSSEGWLIFDPSKDDPGAYRYGPSIIINEDDSIDIWFASPGGPGSDGVYQWDWIRHRRSEDGGKTWSAETIVLKANENSRDRMSVCDPGVIKFGGYYYLGVTAVEDTNGNCNEVFVARSKSPTGPYEKWNGFGWGGDPAPLVEFRSPEDVWGAGEPSFVKKDDTLFIYYTWWSRHGDGTPVEETRVATAPANDPNWPGKTTYRGVAFKREQAEDSTDVKYIDAAGKFLALATAKRFTTESYITVRESTDGISWSKPEEFRSNIKAKCHNMGVSGTPEGHIDINAKNFIAYAFADGTRPGVSWGYWHTFLNPVIISVAPKESE